WIKFMKDGVNATPLPTVNTTGYIDHAAFLGTINPDTNKIPKHLFQGYLNIYNNYFKAPWMPDRTEANPNELNQDDARYGFQIGRASCRERVEVMGVGDVLKRMSVEGSEWRTCDAR